MTKKFIDSDGKVQVLDLTTICEGSHSVNMPCDCSKDPVRDAALKLLQNLLGTPMFGPGLQQLLP